MNSLSSWQYAIFRIYLGLYLSFLLVNTLPSSTALWSDQGIVPDSRLNQTYGIFPNLLDYLDAPFSIKIFLALMIVGSVLFTIGYYRRWAALILWYGWTCLLNRNNMIINPSIHYIGWLLIASVIIPEGESFAVTKRREGWSVPRELVTGAWILFAIGYFLSGWDKLFSPSWADGSALYKIMSGPLGRTNSILLTWIPAEILKMLSWSVIALEMLCLPLALFSITRKWAWLIVTLLQINILLFMNISVIVYGMFTIHLFLFDPRWFKLWESIAEFKAWIVSKLSNRYQWKI